MPSGFFLGGAARGARENKKLDILQGQLAAEKNRDRVTQINDTTKQLIESAKLLITSVDADPSKSRDMVKPSFEEMVNSGLQTYKMAGIDPTPFVQSMKGIWQSPTREQVLANQAQEKQTMSFAEESGKQMAKPPEAPKELTGQPLTLKINGQEKSYRLDDPQVTQLLSQGAEVVKSPTIEREIMLPILSKLLAGEELSTAEQNTYDALKNIGAVEKIVRDALGTSGNKVSDDEILLQQARQAIVDGKDDTEVKKKLKSLGVDPNRL